jgi:hypothetical protein
MRTYSQLITITRFTPSEDKNAEKLKLSIISPINYLNRMIHRGFDEIYKKGKLPAFIIFNYYECSAEISCCSA